MHLRVHTCDRGQLGIGWRLVSVVWGGVRIVRSRGAASWLCIEERAEAANIMRTKRCRWVGGYCVGIRGGRGGEMGVGRGVL